MGPAGGVVAIFPLFRIEVKIGLLNKMIEIIIFNGYRQCRRPQHALPGSAPTGTAGLRA